MATPEARFSEVTKQALEQQVVEAKAQLEIKQKMIHELVEKLQLEETLSGIYKQDFEAERADRQKLHQSFTDQLYHTRSRCEELEQEFKKARIKFEQGKTDKITEMEDEIQILTAQCNAYSRMVDRQKELVSQNQRKHKAEVNELNEKLNEEIKSNQYMANELNRERQQHDQECTRLEKQIENMRNANKVLMEKVLAFKKSTQSQLELEEKLHQAKEENVSLRNELSKLQSSWKVDHEAVTLSKKELGRGGWGVVWVGQFRGHPVAVKELHEAIRSPLYLENLHREINTMSQLRHPNLLQFIGAVLDHPSGNPMIITEVMDTSLRSAYERKELTPDPGCRPVILSIMRDVAVGLNYLHCLPDPIIHRDVSSANVLLESKGDKKWKTKISDFGSAKAVNKAVTRLPGAEPYTAPEALAQHIMSKNSKKEQTTKMDVFSYGVLLCEIITCRFPDRYVFEDMLHQVQSISSRPVGTSDTQGPLLHSLIVLCCHDDPLQRPSMSKIIKQLDVIAVKEGCSDFKSGQKEMQSLTTAKVLSDDNDDLQSFGEKPLMTAEELAARFRIPEKVNESRLPYDPNLVCPKCGKQYLVGEIQKLRRHINEQCKDYNRDKDHDKKVQKESRNLTTTEFLFHDDDDDHHYGRPLDPNLICPKCGKQYRVGEIQKLRRHINDKCPAK